MNYKLFKQMVAEEGWTLPQIRCEVSPPQDMLDMMDRIGLGLWEKWALQLEKELGK